MHFQGDKKVERDNLISIIVPIYNAEKYLHECINSILNQTYKSFELILVDDGSNDKSWEIISEYSRKYNKIIGIKKKNRGSNSARKRGLEIASGKFIMFVDADDYIDKSLCSKLIYFMLSEDVDIVLSREMKILDGEKIGAIGKWPQGKYSGITIAENIINLNCFYSENMSGGLCADLFKKEIISPIFRSVDLEIFFGEDYACLLLALLDSKYVYFLEECLYYYRQNQHSTMHTYTRSNYTSTRYLYHFLISELKSRKSTSKIYKQIEYIIFYCLLLGGYEVFKAKPFLFPFKNVKNGSKIIIYGSGIFGGSLYNYISQYKKNNIVLWVDKKHTEYRDMGFPVFSIDSIFQTEYDYIVIAILRTEIALQAKKELEQIGIDSEKIVLIDQALISFNELPKDF